MFLTAEQTGRPMVFSLRQHDRYLAVDRFGWRVRAFDIGRLAEALGREAGGTWQEHATLILLACCDKRLFEWLDMGGS